MKFNLIICTHKRPQAISKLLDSVMDQSLLPDEILVVDGSMDNTTRDVCELKSINGLKYFKVGDIDRGLTRQRNFGIAKTRKDIEVICFVDDDTILTTDYFKNLMITYEKYPDAIGVGGYVIIENHWERIKGNSNKYDYVAEDWGRSMGSRNLLRKKLSLLSNKPPGIMPEFSHGFSIGFLPPTGNTYPVEFFMGCSASFKTLLFQKVEFSEYFEGYGLYEDMDFCLRASREGSLYVNTDALLYHYHEENGRPNKFEYGKMVIRNGWYVWKVKYPHSSIKAILKWHGTAFILTLVRFGNVINTNKRLDALTESLGRIVGWVSLFFRKPK